MDCNIHDITMSTYEEKNVKELGHEITKLMKIYDEFADSDKYIDKYIEQLNVLINISYDVDFSEIIVCTYGERLINHFVHTYDKNKTAREAKKYSLIQQLSVHDKLHDELVNKCGVIEVVVNIMTNQSNIFLEQITNLENVTSQLQLQCKCCCILKNLTKNLRWGLLICSLGGIDLLLKIMTIYPNEVDIQTHAIVSLYNLAHMWGFQPDVKIVDEENIKQMNTCKAIFIIETITQKLFATEEETIKYNIKFNSPYTSDIKFNQQKLQKILSSSNCCYKLIKILVVSNKHKV